MTTVDLVAPSGDTLEEVSPNQSTVRLLQERLPEGHVDILEVYDPKTSPRITLHKLRI